MKIETKYSIGDKVFHIFPTQYCYDTNKMIEREHVIQSVVISAEIHVQPNMHLNTSYRLSNASYVHEHEISYLKEDMTNKL